MIARGGNQCDPTALAELLDDQLSGQDQQSVAEHLSHCHDCQHQLEALAGETRWWNDAREVLSQFALQASDTQRDAELTPKSPTDQPPTAEKSSATQFDHEHWVLGLLQPPTEAIDASGQAILGQLDGLPVSHVVGQGGMGVVLRARDPHLQRSLAIKLLSPMLATTGAARQRFFREAQAAAAIVHPNIVPIYAISTERSLPYLVMPYIAGGNLQQHLDAEGPLPLERVLSIGLQIAEGLSAAHEQGIVHRDIKPANLMLDEGGFRVLITDFGLARALDDATLTGSGMLAGTPQYMSPEQARSSSIDHRSDLYSLGGVLYALATGRPPVQGSSTFEILRSIGEAPRDLVLQLNERYPAWFDRLLAVLMAPDVNHRIASAEEAAQLLRACLAHSRAPHQTPLPKSMQGSAANWKRATWGWSVLAGLVGLLVLGATIATPWLAAKLDEPTGSPRLQDFSAAAAPPSSTVAEVHESKERVDEMRWQMMGDIELKLNELRTELGLPPLPLIRQ
ncbi:serine/threonine-protein kinase [Aureliella helgolandensis]|uniref:Serine/threonine-protein kinase PrkC n=1 Tax=Aureliella helgolandensis TaxID=2527968 RepID=A0A518G0Q1_9BACT|nr:serine/threonine-protein kinase [Aureliella helgolandensis]QDV22181.1 Serine/threonine-protein kinase PrkC [Aureliella helgolandensis]